MLAAWVFFKFILFLFPSASQEEIDVVFAFPARCSVSGCSKQHHDVFIQVL